MFLIIIFTQHLLKSIILYINVQDYLLENDTKNINPINKV